MFLFVFIVGLALTSLTAKNLADDGLVPQEGAVLLIMSILTGLALLLATVIRVTEIRHGADEDDDDWPDRNDAPAGQAPKVDPPERPNRMPVPPPVSSGAGASRGLAVRPDQKLPPGSEQQRPERKQGWREDLHAEPVDPEGKAADHG